MSHYPDDAVQSKSLFARAQASLPGGNTRTTVFMQPFPLYATHGVGCRIWDADGTERIDCINNFTAGIHGHAHPALTEAAQRQLALGSAFGLPTASEIDLAELLCSRIASVDRVRFCNSGSEAVMMALKAARAFTLLQDPDGRDDQGVPRPLAFAAAGLLSLAIFSPSRLMAARQVACEESRSF